MRRNEIIGKKVRALFIALLTVLMMLGCVESASAAVSLNKKTLTAYVSGTYQLKVKGTDKKATWSTSNKKIATVSAKGLVTAKKAGKATIKAKVSGKTYSCKVTVYAKPKLSPSKVTVKKGATAKITLKKSNGAKVTPTKYTSSNKNVATVSSKGVITGKKAGTCKIYTYLGSIKYTTTVTVSGGSSGGTGTTGGTTSRPLAQNVYIEEEGDIELTVGEQFKVNIANVLPTGADKRVTWASNDTSILKVVSSTTDSCTVKAVAVGSTSLVARAKDGSGAKDTLKFVVKKKTSGTSDTTGTSGGNNTTSTSSVTSVALYQINRSGELVEAEKEVSAIAGDILDFVAYAEPISITARTIKWTSSNTSVAVVDSSGQITTKSKGTAVITASCEGKSSSVSIVVEAAKTKVVAYNLDYCPFPNYPDINVYLDVPMKTLIQDIKIVSVNNAFQVMLPFKSGDCYVYPLWPKKAVNKAEKVYDTVKVYQKGELIASFDFNCVDDLGCMDEYLAWKKKAVAQVCTGSNPVDNIRAFANYLIQNYKTNIPSSLYQTYRHAYQKGYYDDCVDAASTIIDIADDMGFKVYMHAHPETGSKYHVDNVLFYNGKWYVLDASYYEGKWTCDFYEHTPHDACDLQLNSDGTAWNL